MQTAGTISGNVYDSSSLDPLGGVSVYVYNSAGEYAGETSTSATDGSYAITGLGDSSYQVRFEDSGYDEQWYDGKDETTADWVSVSPGANTEPTTLDLVATGGSLPVVDTVTSSTHPDPSKWYSNSHPSFSWVTNAFSQTITGYSCVLDQSPTTLPAASATTTTADWGYTGIADGVWYFHVRAETGAGWPGATALKIQIDTHAPTATAKALSVKAAKAKKGKTLKIRVTISDPKPTCGGAALDAHPDHQEGRQAGEPGQDRRADQQGAGGLLQAREDTQEGQLLHRLPGDRRGPQRAGDGEEGRS